ncbi:MAG: choice-of-anchor D domain-containing protein [Candidatus Hatepunaea meridiana]|nr:choice-of-anchor D domain-containing protein [Candidatus Hatepunaea meridiana]
MRYLTILLTATLFFIPFIPVRGEITEVGQCDTPGSAHDVFILGDYAYIADGDGGLTVIDISDPEDPEVAGNWDGFAGTFGWIFVIGEVVYLSGQNGLFTLDVSDIENIELLDRYPLRQEWRGVYVVNEIAYLAQQRRGFSLIDVSNPRDLTEISNIDLFDAINTEVVNDLAYVANGSHGLVIIDVSDAENPEIISRIGGMFAWYVQVSGDYAYVCDLGGDSGGLRIIDTSDPEDIEEVGYCHIRRVGDVFVSGDYAFIGQYEERNVYVVDISDSEDPEIAETYETDATTRGVTVVDNYAYIANYNNGLLILDVSDYTLIGPRIGLSEEELDFEDVGLNLSCELPLTITNIGNEDLTVSDISIEGDCFTVDFEDEFTLEPDEEAEITVTFAPEERGEFEGTMTITSDDEENEEVEVALLGVGVGAAIRCYPRTLNFDIVGIDSSEELTLRISSRGLNDLIVSDIANENDVFVADFEGEITIEPARRHELTVTFTPTQGIAYADTLRIASNDPDNEIVYVPMSGRGEGAVIVIIPDMVLFGDVGLNRLADRVITIGNTGELNLNIGEIFVEGAWFSVDLDTVYVVEPDESIDATLTFAPQEVGDFRAMLFISSDDRQREEVIVPLYGTGAGPCIAVDRDTIDFGLLQVNHHDGQFLNIRADGLTDLTVSDVSVEGEYFSTFFEDEVFIELGNRLQLFVTFAPEDDGLFEGTLTITSDDPDNGEVEVFLYGYAHRGVIFDTPESAVGVTVVEDHAYIAGTGYLHIVDIYNREDPVGIMSYNPRGLCVNDVAVDSVYVFIAGGENGLMIVDVSDFDNPQIASEFDTPGYAYSVALNEDYAYIADGESGLRVIDLYDLERLEEVNSVDTPGEARGITISGNYAYIADDVHGLRIIDIANPQEPVEVGYYNTRGWSYDVSVSGDYAYVADERYGMRVIDVSDPENPDEVGFYDTAGNAYGVYISGCHAFLADGVGGLCMFDVSEPENPNLVKTFYTPGTARDVFIAGDYAYVADDESGLLIMDITEFLDVDVAAVNQIPDDFILSPAYPNPFNSTTTFNYALPTPANINLAVYNPLGHRIFTLFQGYRQAGFHTINLNARDLPTGLYFVRLEAYRKVMCGKVMVVK